MAKQKAHPGPAPRTGPCTRAAAAPSPGPRAPPPRACAHVGAVRSHAHLRPHSPSPSPLYRQRAWEGRGQEPPRPRGSSGSGEKELRHAPSGRTRDGGCEGGPRRRLRECDVLDDAEKWEGVKISVTENWIANLDMHKTLMYLFRGRNGPAMAECLRKASTRESYVGAPAAKSSSPPSIASSGRGVREGNRSAARRPARSSSFARSSSLRLKGSSISGSWFSKMARQRAFSRLKD